MKGTDVKEHAELYLNTTLEDSAVLMLINESLNMIGDLALNDQEVMITTSVEGEWKPLPDDTTNVKAVYSGNNAVDDCTSAVCEFDSKDREHTKLLSGK